MPKIVIREFDKTKAVGPEYASFAVVVPGFLGDGADEAVLDKNGVYECSSRDDFEKNIKINPNATVLVDEAKGPAIDKTFGEEPKALTETEFNNLLAQGNLYVVAVKGAEAVGKLVDEDYIYEKVTTNNGYIFKTEVVETPEEGTDEPEVVSEDTTEYTLFAVLSDEGHDDIYETHYGNQIAYELLNLGYTVLYKVIESTSDLTDPSWWKPLKDRSEYDFRYIISGLLGTPSGIASEMVSVAKFDPEDKAFDEVNVLSAGRGDCIALLDIEPSIYGGVKTQEEIITRVHNGFKNIPTSKYAAAFMPTVTYTTASMDAKYSNRTFPASFHYLACAARSSERFSEWYANAGYTRGISNYNIESTGCVLGEAAVNAFQYRFKVGNANLAINPIIKLRNSYYLWGNRTTYALGDKNTDEGDLRASHFLNIRQLCCTLKKQVYVACRQFTFDPNSVTLWTNFCNTIRPTLEKMKTDQGISDYKILKVKSDRKAFLSAIIRIVPIEAVEDFDISVYLEDSIAGTIANTEESE